MRTFASAFGLKLAMRADKKKEFFDKTYINREVVVQEAGMLFLSSLLGYMLYIYNKVGRKKGKACLGKRKRNEPFNFFFKEDWF